MKQTTMFAAFAKRDVGMARVEEKAEREAPGFGELARDFVLEYLEEHGPKSGEDITDECKKAGIVPHNDRAFGPVFVSLSRKGLIAKVGFVKRRKGHGADGACIWMSNTEKKDDEDKER